MCIRDRGVGVYMFYRAKIPTHNVQNAVLCVIIGLGLGLMSAFLGIGEMCIRDRHHSGDGVQVE